MMMMIDVMYLREKLFVYRWRHQSGCGVRSATITSSWRHQFHNAQTCWGRQCWIRRLRRRHLRLLILLWSQSSPSLS